MLIHQFRVLLLCLVCTWTFQVKSLESESKSDEHIRVVLRMVGHQILLNNGDSTSLVLPVTHVNQQYKIEFNTTFAFEPNYLAETVNRVIHKTKLSKNYRVEVLSCESNQVVYSYEVGQTDESDIIPCGLRVQPKACYYILFTLLNTKPEESLTDISTTPNRFPWLIVILIILSTGLLLFSLKKKKKSLPNPNFIQLGEFQFDQRNMTLILKEKKIELSGKESELLLLLYQAVNTTVEKEVLLRSVWDDDGDYVGRTLDVFVSKLRKKLEFDPKVKILNVRGVGYKLVMGND